MPQKTPDQITLHYFNFKGLAEVARFLLAYADVEYTDNRVDHVNEWPKIKQEQPFHQFPKLEAEGEVITEALAMYLYIAERFQLSFGKNPLQRAKESSLIHHISDFYEILKVMQSNGELDKFATETVPFYLERFEKRVNEHGNFLYDQISWVEVSFAATIDILESKGRLNKANLLLDYPKLSALRKKIVDKPSLATYLERRPYTEN